MSRSLPLLFGMKCPDLLLILLVTVLSVHPLKGYGATSGQTSRQDEISALEAVVEASEQASDQSTADTGFITELLLNLATDANALTALNAHISEWEQGRRQLLSDLDGLSRIKTDYLADLIVSLADQAVVRELEGATGKQWLRWAHKMAQVHEQYNLYLKTRPFFGTSKDNQRTESFRGMTAAAFDLIRAAEGITAKERSRRSSPSPQFKINDRQTMTSLARLGVAALRFAPAFLTPGQLRSAQGFSRFLDIIDAAGPIAFWPGFEFIDPSKALDARGPMRADGVNVIVMNHSNSHLDKFVMAHILRRMPGKSMIIGAAHGWKSDAFARLAMSSESIVSVGQRHGVKSQDAIDAVLARFDGGFKNLFLFPEGSTGGGLGEIKPLSPGFQLRLIPRIAARFKLRILIATTADTYSMMGLSPAGMPHPARVHIGPVLESGAVQYLLNGGPSLLETYIRSIWLSHMETSTEKVLGQFRLSILVNSIRSRLAPSDGSPCFQSLI